ncbi:MAG: hypothetical protein JW734_07100 [Candidatus Omnitrophica bacterium]|nr:hypothetical protein [Candidatus Omnitrophota bacterium]
MKKPHIFLIILFLAGLGVFILKDYFIKAYAISYIKKEFGVEAVIKSLHLGLNSLTVTQAAFKDNNAQVNLKSLRVDFKLPEILKPQVSKVSLQGLDCKIKDVEAAKSKFIEKFSGKQPAAPALEPQLDLENVKISLEVNKIKVDVDFSFKGTVLGNKINKLGWLEVNKCNVSSDDFSVDNLRLKEAEQGLHILKINRIKIKGKSINDPEASLEVENDKIFIRQFSHYLLGSSSKVTGTLNLNEYADMCVNLNFSDIAFDRIVQLFGLKDSLRVEGLFAGALDMSLKDFKPENLGASFTSLGAGVVDVKKESPLAFLKGRLDKESYKTLVETLKDYKYNKASLKVTSKGKNLLFNIDLLSAVKEKRDVIVNFNLAWEVKNVQGSNYNLGLGSFGLR